MTVRSPKTERHESKEERTIPIFPELRPHLEAVWEQAEPGAVFVISRYRKANSMRKPFERIIQLAGLKPWPKLFHNLRGTRETELADTYPIHVVCAWIGNSQAVAKEHYLQVTDEHFATAQITAQTAAVQTGKGEKSKTPAAMFTEENRPLHNCTHGYEQFLTVEFTAMAG